MVGETNQLNQGIEKRGELRLYDRRPIRIEDVKEGVNSNAELVNYSKNGLYFETDEVFQPREEIFIGIDNSPFSSDPGVFECYRGIVLWGKKLADSFFEYGYGIRFFFGNEIESSEQNDFLYLKRKDLRRYPRKLYYKSIFFATAGKVHQGLIKDISQSGAFIKTNDSLPTREPIILDLPLKNGNRKKVEGLVAWKNSDGFGVRFYSRGQK